MGAGYWPVQICYSHEVSQTKTVDSFNPFQLQFQLPLYRSPGATYNSYTVTQCTLVLRTMLYGDLMWRYMQCTLYNSYTVTRSTPPTTIGCQLGPYTGYRLELFPIPSFYPPRQKLIWKHESPNIIIDDVASTIDRRDTDDWSRTTKVLVLNALLCQLPSQLRTHSGEKANKCNQCDFASYNKGSGSQCSGCCHPSSPYPGGQYSWTLTFEHTKLCKPWNLSAATKILSNAQLLPVPELPSVPVDKWVYCYSLQSTATAGIGSYQASQLTRKPFTFSTKDSMLCC